MKHNRLQPRQREGSRPYRVKAKGRRTTAFRSFQNAEEEARVLKSMGYKNVHIQYQDPRRNDS